MTINWAIMTDYFQTKRYIKRKLSFKKFINPTKQWINLILTKILYYSIWIILPILILDFAWWKILIGFFIMHYTAGIILSTIFQVHLTHIIVLEEFTNNCEEALSQSEPNVVKLHA